MRNTNLYGTSLLACLALSACGDDGGKTHLADAAIDSPKQMDAPAAICTIPATIPAGSVGTMAAPASGNFVVKSTMGSMPVFFGLRIYTTMDMKNDVSFIVPRPANGFAPGTFAFDTTGAAMPVALAYMGGNYTGTMAQKELDATNGSITFTSIGQTAGASIKGTVSSTIFKEVDANGNQVAGGCTSTVAGLSFFLTQMTTVTRNADGMTTPESWKFQIEGQQPQILTVE